MRTLTKKNSDFIWTGNCEKAFDTFKNILTSDSCIQYFEAKKPVRISAVSLQQLDGKDPNVIAYSSRSLSDTEKRYSQIERELLSITYSCERNRLYLFGCSFTIFRDSQALVHILNNPNSKLPPRLKRMILHIHGYNFVLQYVRSEQNMSNFISRHLSDSVNRDIVTFIDMYVIFLTETATPNAINLTDIKKATAQDPMLTKLKDLILNHTWYTLRKNASDSITVELKSYNKIKKSLIYNNHHDVILKNNRTVLLKVYYKIAITLAHHGHQGIIKTKVLL